MCLRIKLRFKLFESVVSPSLLYGLTTAPLTQVDYGTVDAAQRKMLRSVVGHVPCRNDDWADMHRRMSEKSIVKYHFILRLKTAMSM